MENSICIISFSPIPRDARVLRQLKYLSPHFNLTVIGYDHHHDDASLDLESLAWHPVAKASNGIFVKAIRLVMLVLGRLVTPLYDVWYWGKAHHQQALAEAIASKSQLYYANDWDALPVAVKAADRVAGTVIVDLHEFAPLEFENIWFWRLLHSPMIRYFLRRYAAAARASITVAPLIAARYRQEFALDPIVVLNAPHRTPHPERTIEPQAIRLIHHGVANRDRRLEVMIETIAKCDQRFSLHLMLIETDPAYVCQLKALAAELATERVVFHPPESPIDIVTAISAYDIGFYPLAPTSYNNAVALPNKFFDFIMAGLAICIGPSPAMSELVREHGFGCVAPSFDPADIAATLNGLTVPQITAMQRAAMEASTQFNADQEMTKVVRLCHELMEG